MAESFEKTLDKLFGGMEKKKNLRCPKCKNAKEFSVFLTAIALAKTNKSRKILEITDLQVDTHDSLWCCDACNCIFDEHGDIIASTV